jgi:hypothetical protein
MLQQLQVVAQKQVETLNSLYLYYIFISHTYIDRLYIHFIFDFCLLVSTFPFYSAPRYVSV